MKKLLTIAALIGATAQSFGQGQVTFNNSGPTMISTNALIGGSLGNPFSGPISPWVSGGLNYVFGLFVAPSTVTSVNGAFDPNWAFTGAYATNSSATTGGRIAGGQPILPAPYASGTTFNFMVRGWSTAIAGLDWNAAQAFEHFVEIGGASRIDQFFGHSGIATILVGGGILPSAVLFETIPGVTIQGFALTLPTPEPSTLALAGLGAAAFLIFHRRNLEMPKVARDQSEAVSYGQRRLPGYLIRS